MLSETQGIQKGDRHILDYQIVRSIISSLFYIRGLALNIAGREASVSKAESRLSTGWSAVQA